jgi:uncharacterized tellurite resistance protein B-like protein
MIKKIGELMARLSGGDLQSTMIGSREDDLRTATAVLMMSIAKSDMELDQSELDNMADLLGAHFKLLGSDVGTLVEVARQQAEDAVSLQSFTRELHEQLSDAEKRRVVEMLWRVAIADGVVSRNEANLANKIARLLYLKESEVAMVRVKVLDELEEKMRGKD